MPYAVVSQVNESSVNNNDFLYLLHGLFGSFDNWLNNTDLTTYIEKYDFKVVCVSGGDSWYVDGEGDSELSDSYFIKELIPEVESHFVVGENKVRRSIAGNSMGGYGAFKFAFKNPDKFVFAAALSGAFHAAEIFDYPENADCEILFPSIMKAFGDAESQCRRDNDLFRIISDFPFEQIPKLPFLYFNCGDSDSFLSVNDRLATLFAEKEIPYEYERFSGGHDWFFWDSRIDEVLMNAEKCFKSAKA